MMRSASTPAILALLLGGTLATLPAGCRTEQVAIGQQDSGGQTTSTMTGGAVAGTTSVGGATASGGSAQTGGIAAAGGANAGGGSTNTGGISVAGGTKASGGATTGLGGSGPRGGTSSTGGHGGAGGAGSGGATTCASGWTMCCGQCLSPLAGVCAPCSGTGGASSTGGIPGTGGTGAGGSSGVVCGGLRGVPCSTGQFCDLPSGSCNTSADVTGICTVKSTVCPTISQPVCGCDGKTYSSDCNRIAAGVTKKSDGACATTDAGVCPANETWCPGCPSLGIAGGCGQVCPAIACLAPDAGTSDAASGSCSAITTQAACDGRSDCHSVFADPGTCGCAGVNCCMHFNHCADGGRANCTGPVACLAPQPACLPPYTLAYTNVCFEGCVLQTECAGVDAAVTPPACPQSPPTNGSSCGLPSTIPCFYDNCIPSTMPCSNNNCPSTGRTQATCGADSAWSVQTAACGAVSCASPAGTRTCPSGQMCLITEGGTLGVQCVANTCGQGPVTPECGTTLGSCVVNASLISGVTITCNTCPAGTTCA